MYLLDHKETLPIKEAHCLVDQKGYFWLTKMYPVDRKETLPINKANCLVDWKDFLLINKVNVPH
jgi:hypothetical protein